MRAITKLLTCVALIVWAMGTNAAVITYQSSLSPEAPNATGSGSVVLTFDTLAATLTINANWSGLSGNTTVAHIHCCTADPFAGTVGVAVTPTTLPGFPVGVTAGTYLRTVDLFSINSFTSSFYSSSGGTVQLAQAALLSGLDAGRAYFNIHTTTFPGGEIRGFPQRVSEPASLALLALTCLSFLVTRGGRRLR